MGDFIARLCFDNPVLRYITSLFACEIFSTRTRYLNRESSYENRPIFGLGHRGIKMDGRGLRKVGQIKIGKFGIKEVLLHVYTFICVLRVSQEASLVRMDRYFVFGKRGKEGFVESIG